MIGIRNAAKAADMPPFLAHENGVTMKPQTGAEGESNKTELKQLSVSLKIFQIRRCR